MLIFRLMILRSRRVYDGRKRRLTTDKSDLTRDHKYLKRQKEKKKEPVVEISGFEVVEAVEAE